MKKKIKVKWPFLSLVLILPIFVITLCTNKSLKENDYVTPTTINESLPVITVKKMIVNPFIDSNVKIGKSYYDYKAEEDSQKNSILINEDTYIQNNGIDFVSESTFDVVAILSGTVEEVKEDTVLGKEIRINHDNGYISTINSLSEVTVKKGDIITQGQQIGKSGENELYKELGNHIHLELEINGQIVNPELYLDKEMPEKNS